MKKSAYIFLAATALFASASCQSEIRPDEELPVDDGILCFQPTLNGSSTDLVPDSDPASQTKVSEIVSTDGSISIPLTYVVTDGIACQTSNDISRNAELDSASPLTKGTQLNTTDDWDRLDNYIDTFYVAAWKGTTSFVPANTQVTKSSPLWKTSGTYRWGATEEATFYAYANLPASGATVTPMSTVQALNYTSVPSSSSAQTDILMGYYSGYSKFSQDFHKGGIAEIKFYHPLTAVRFKKGTFEGYASDKVNIKSISIKNVYSSGIALMSSTSINWNNQTGTKTVTMSPASGDTYLSVDANGFIGDAFLLIPQTMTATAYVTINAIVNLDGTEKKFEAKLTNNSWEAGKTNIYTLGYDSTNYVFTITNSSGSGSSLLSDGSVCLVYENTTGTQQRKFKISSYKYTGSTDDEANRTAVSYDAWYSFDDKDITDPSKVWYQFETGSLGTELTGLTGTNNAGMTTATDKTLTAAGRQVLSISPYKWTTESMKGSATSRLDLSKMSIGGEGDGTGPQNTANCYIVKHPGYYKFPCVYGNSIKNGVAVSATSGYNNSGYVSSAPHKENETEYNTTVLYNFVNSQGADITTGNIISDVSDDISSFTSSKVKAAMVWCDAKENGETLVKNVSYSDGYISFETMSPANLVQGNAVIALYYDADNDGYDEGEALWSWQIWVTDADLSVNNVGYVGDSKSGYHSFMSRYLGWCDGRNADGSNLSIYKAAHNSIQIRLKQSAGYLGYKYIIVQQNDVINGPYGDCSYYQWGRKDPFTGSTGLSSNETKKYYDSNGNELSWLTGTSTIFPTKSSGQQMSLVNAEKVIYNSIRNPRTFCSNDCFDARFYNLWSRDNNQVKDAGLSVAVVKTIYDPSPAGYRLPNNNAFISMSKTGKTTSSSSEMNGIWDTGAKGFRMLNADGLLDDNLFFQASGSRENGGGLGGVATNAYIWTSCLADETLSYCTRIYQYGISFPFGPHNKTLGHVIKPVLE